MTSGEELYSGTCKPDAGREADLLRGYMPLMPPDQWQEISAFVREVVDDSIGAPYDARRLLNTVMHHVAWGWKAGLPLDRSELFNRSTIDASISLGFGHLSKGSLSTIRAQLLRVGERVAPERSLQRLVVLPSSGVSVPYKAPQLAELNSWARFQRTEHKRKSALALVALGAGAGLSAGEVLSVRVGDIKEDEWGLLVKVVGSRARVVPLLEFWRPSLQTAIAGLAPIAFAFRPGNRTQQANSITNFIYKSHGVGLRPQSQRLRATWIVHHLQNATPVAVLLKAAGVDSLEAFTRYIPFLDLPAPVVERAQLHGNSA